MQATSTHSQVQYMRVLPYSAAMKSEVLAECQDGVIPPKGKEKDAEMYVKLTSIQGFETFDSICR